MEEKYRRLETWKTTHVNSSSESNNLESIWRCNDSVRYQKPLFANLKKIKNKGSYLTLLLGIKMRVELDLALSFRYRMLEPKINQFLTWGYVFQSLNLRFTIYLSLIANEMWLYLMRVDSSSKCTRDN